MINNDDYFCIKCLIEGDEEAFVMLYNKYHKKLYWVARKMTQSEEVAQDVTQDVFLKIWENRTSIDPHQNFAAYINSICKNVVYDFFKKATLEESVINQMQEFAEMTTPEKDNEDFYESYKELLHKAIENLPPKRRQIYESCKLQGKSYDNVGNEYNISRSTILDHIVKANKFIKEYLLKNGNISFAMLFAILSQLTR